MTHELSLNELKKKWHGSMKAYIVGFSASIILTAASFILVVTKAFSGPVIIYSIVVLALIQATVQLRFFLHMGQEAKPRWETLVFYFMLLVLLIIALGSLWVMNDLNERMMDDMQAEMKEEKPHD